MNKLRMVQDIKRLFIFMVNNLNNIIELSNLSIISGLLEYFYIKLVHKCLL